MKNIIIFGFIIVGFFSSCGSSSNGELVGIQDLTEFHPTDPYGMVRIPKGTFSNGVSVHSDTFPAILYKP